MPYSQVEQEELRIAALHETGLLDTAREAPFDQLVGLAAQICATPMSLLTLVDRERQWFKASVGVEVRETSRGSSFCAHAIEQADLFLIEDLASDARFRENPLVRGTPAVRFYAGMPLAGPRGALLGTVCVLDVVPRTLNDVQRSALAILAAQAEAQIALRVQARQLRKARKAAQSFAVALRASEHRFRTFMDNAPFVSFLKDDEGQFVFYNQRLAHRFGVNAEEWLGKSDFDIWPPETANLFRAHDVEVMRAGKLIESEEETYDRAGAPTVWKTYKFPCCDERGKMMLGGIAVDLTEEHLRQSALATAVSQLEKLATCDPMTGLANRRVLDERVDYEFQLAKRHKTHFSILLLDLDDFKQRNDRFGHASGDEVLRTLGRLITATLRTTDLAARYGGEEFVVLLPGADAVGAVLFAERLRTAMHGERWPDGALTASSGIATMDVHTVSGKRLMGLADDAMYEAKRMGKDRIVAHRAGTSARTGTAETDPSSES